jgi:hypothetical protein
MFSYVTLNCEAIVGRLRVRARDRAPDGMLLRIVATLISSQVDGDIAQIRGQPGRLAPRVWSAWRRATLRSGAAPPRGSLERQRS